MFRDRFVEKIFRRNNLIIPQIVDQDGLPRVTKGSANQSALHLEKKDGKVFLTASFTPNPIYYLQIQRDSQMFLTGSLWFGEEKRNRLNTIGGVMPKSCEQIVTTMDKCKEEVRGQGFSSLLGISVCFVCGSFKLSVNVKFIFSIVPVVGWQCCRWWAGRQERTCNWRIHNFIFSVVHIESGAPVPVGCAESVGPARRCHQGGKVRHQGGFGQARAQCGGLGGVEAVGYVIRVLGGRWSSSLGIEGYFGLNSGLFFRWNWKESSSPAAVV